MDRPDLFKEYQNKSGSWSVWWLKHEWVNDKSAGMNSAWSDCWFWLLKLYKGVKMERGGKRNEKDSVVISVLTVLLDFFLNLLFFLFVCVFLLLVGFCFHLELTVPCSSFFFLNIFFNDKIWIPVLSNLFFLFFTHTHVYIYYSLWQCPSW